MGRMDHKLACAGLWRQYRRTRDTRARDQLLDRNLGLVHRAARAAFRPGTQRVELGDLVGAGTLGLIQAIEGFDPSRGFAFSTYAMPRIRGAILDELHGQEWVPRSVRVHRRQIGRAEERLQQQLGDRPGPVQLAEALSIDLRTFWRWWVEAQGRTVMALDQHDEDAGAETLPLFDLIPDQEAVDPPDALAQAQLLERMRVTLRQLADRDRLVLTLYYFEGLTLGEIGRVLRISESRVCQIHGRALRRLRREL